MIQNNWHFKLVEVAKLPQGSALLLLQSRDAEWYEPDGSGEAAHPFSSFMCNSLKPQTNPDKCHSSVLLDEILTATFNPVLCKRALPWANAAVSIKE